MSTATIKDWRDYPSGKEKYQLYLASRDWAILKEQVRARSGGHCERCFGEAENVHHQTYERVYQERLDDLIHLCIPCHEFIHNHRGDDPFLSTPVRLGGRQIRTVYLAGKITGTTWRDEIMPDWSKRVSDWVFDIGEWFTIDRCLPIPDGRLLNFSGPFWRPYDSGGHGHGCSTDVSERHAFTGSGLFKHHDEDERSGFIFDQITESIAKSDLIFAWIDSTDCYGTLVELGYARALGKAVVVAAPPSFCHDLWDLWVAVQTSTVSMPFTETPKQAWDFVFSPERLRRSR